MIKKKVKIKRHRRMCIKSSKKVVISRLSKSLKESKAVIKEGRTEEGRKKSECGMRR